MAATVTNIGTATGSVVATVAVTVPAGGVPKGALIVACVADSSVAVVGGSIADSRSNTYTRITGADNNNLTTNGFGAIFYAFNIGTALLQNDTITYTLALTASAAMTAFYVPGARAFADPLDSAVTTAATGSSTTPSVAGGVPGGSGELHIGAVSNTGGSAETFTQDSANGAWGTPPVRVGLAGGPTIAGGELDGASAALTYAPTLGTSHPWAAMVVAFKMAQPSFDPFLQMIPIQAQ